MVETYRNFITGQDGGSFRDGSDRWGDGRIKLTGLELLDKDGHSRGTFRSGEPLRVALAYAMTQPTEDVAFGVSLTKADGTHVFGTNTHLDGLTLEGLPETGRVELVLERQDLTNGVYHLDAAVHSRAGEPYDYWTKAASFTVRSDLEYDGIYRPPHTWKRP